MQLACLGWEFPDFRTAHSIQRAAKFSADGQAPNDLDLLAWRSRSNSIADFALRKDLCSVSSIRAAQDRTAEMVEEIEVSGGRSPTPQRRATRDDKRIEGQAELD